MVVYCRKGQRRLDKDEIRVAHGEPKANFEKNRAPHCRYEKGKKAIRNKGRNRFKTGKKRQKSGKSSR